MFRVRATRFYVGRRPGVASVAREVVILGHFQGFREMSDPTGASPGDPDA